MPENTPRTGRPTVLPGSDFETWEPEDEAPSTAQAPFVVPPRYLDQGELGTGGMSTVRRVVDRDLDRPVAMKIIHAGLALKPDATQRFLGEARATARLEHPGIVPVHEVGQLPDSRPYFTMREVRGQTLDQARQDWSLGRRISAFAQVCETVAYAHDQGVLHRDLKPDNIMVGPYGEVLVLDWGLVKVQEDLPGGASLLEGQSPYRTVQGARMGTPAFMSPEQARGEELEATTDVWSLGVILYLLLTDTLPFEAPTAEALMDTLSTAQVDPVVERAAQAPAELAAIAHRALQAEQSQRYPDAGAMAAEVRAWLSGDRVAAHEYSSWELLSRFVRRNRVLTGAALVVLALVCASSGLLYQAWQQAEDARAQARAEEREAHRNLASGYRAQAERLLLEDEPLAAAVFAAASLHHDPAVPDSPWAFEPLTDTVALAEHILSARSALVAGELSPMVHLGTDIAGEGTALSETGSHATLLDQGERQLLELSTGEVVARWPSEAPVYPVACSDRAVLLLTDEAIELWRAGTEPVQLGPADPRLRATFSPDGSLLALSDGGGELVLWDVATAERVHALQAHEGGLYDIVFSPDGQRMATTSFGVRTWSVAEGALLEERDFQDPFLVLAFHQDGESLYAGSHTGEVYLLASDQEPVLVGEHDSAVYALGVREDGLVASGDELGHIHLWQGEQRLAALHSAGCTVFSLAFEGDDLRVALCATVERWDTRGLVRRTRAMGEQPWSLARAGSDLLVGSELGLVRWDGQDVEVVRERGEIASLVSATADRAAVGWLEGLVELISLPDGQVLGAVQAHEEAIAATQISPDGRWVLTADDAGQVRLWSTPQLELVAEVQAHEASPWAVTWSEDSTQVLTSGRDGLTRRWSVPDLSPTGEVHTEPGMLNTPLFTSQPDQVLLAGREHVLLDLGSGETLRTYPSADTWHRVAHLVREGQWLLTTSLDQHLRVWDVQTGAPLVDLPAHSALVSHAWMDDRLALLSVDELALLPLEAALVESTPEAQLQRAEARANARLAGFSLLPPVE